MKRTSTVFFTAVLAAACLQAPARADDAPWAQADKTVKAAQAAAQSGGIKAVAQYAPALEQALTDAAKLNPPIFRSGDTVYALVDGTYDTFAAMVAFAAGKDPPLQAAMKGATKATPVPSPYLLGSFLLANYYDTVGKPEDALRVVDEGLALPRVLDTGTPDPKGNGPMLIVERGVALGLLKRWPDVLSNDERCLSIPQLPNQIRAIMLRGKGYALTEMGRLDEAEAAYHAALESEPGNATAQKELKYIADLRAGGKPRASELVTANEAAAAACALKAPPQPKALGSGVVVSFEDMPTARARIPAAEASLGGKIDPDYIDNPRVRVQMDGGPARTLLAPKTMLVRVGDHVTAQDTYRNMNLSCNYIPNLIVTDTGPKP